MLFVENGESICPNKSGFRHPFHAEVRVQLDPHLTRSRMKIQSTGISCTKQDNWSGQLHIPDTPRRNKG